MKQTFVYPLMDFLIFAGKMALKVLSLFTILLNEIRIGLVENFQFAREANEESFEESASYAKGKKTYKKLNKSLK